MATRKALLNRILKAIRSGDRRPPVIALAVKVKHCPKEIVHGYERAVDFWLG